MNVAVYALMFLSLSVLFSAYLLLIGKLQLPAPDDEGMYYRVIQGNSQFIAFAKKEPFVNQDVDIFDEPGDLWFEFGDTPGRALKNLKRSMKK